VIGSRLILIRHGLPEGHTGRCVGHFDTRLAEDGKRAIAELASSWISNDGIRPSKIVSSDLRRAADSARIIAKAWDVPLVIDAGLREMHFGEWEGRTWDEIAVTDAERLRYWTDNWTRAAPPGGESLDVFARRVASGLARVRDGVVVSHAGWIRVAVSTLLGERLASTFDRSIDFAHAAILESNARTYELRAFNVANGA
jgi:broad specificity phosphatase PhoE